MDLLMSNEKPAKGKLQPAKEIAVDETPVKGVEVLSLRVDDDFDLGGDPYNRTGSHCIIKVEDDD